MSHSKSQNELRTRNDRFNGSMLSLEKIISGIDDISECRMFSDRGKGADAIYRTVDSSMFGSPPDRHRDLIANLAWLLRRNGKRNLVPMLLLIFKYGGNRRYAIEDIMRKTGKEYKAAERFYFRCRNELICEFVSNPCTEI